MKIKVLFIFGILLCIHCSPKKESKPNLLQFIPENVSAVIKINDFNAFATELKENELIQKVNALNITEKITKVLKPLHYVAPAQEALISFTMDSLKTLDFIFVTSDTIPLLELSDITDKSIETLHYKNFDIKKYEISGDSFYSTNIHGQEVLSSSRILLEQLITSFETPGIHPQIARFYSVSDTSKLGHVWVNLNNSDLLLEYLTNSNPTQLASGYADWLFLDISLGSEGLLLNGIATIEGATKNYLDLFSGTKPLPNTTFEMLPANVSSFTSCTFKDYNAFSANQNLYLDQHPAIDSLFTTVEEIGTAQLENEPLVLLRTYGTELLIDYLKSNSKNTVEFQGSEIWELSETSLLKRTLTPLVSNFKSNYSCVIENTLVFSQEKEVLEQVIIAYKNGRTISKSSLFQNVSEQSTEASSLLTVATSNGFQSKLVDYNFKETADQLKSIDLSDYVFGSENIAETDFFHSSYFIKKIGLKKVKNSISTMFTLQLDTDLRSVPQFVFNHRTKLGELIVQDVDNVLYLISNTGKILWKTQLEGSVQGPIHQVDLYKNGKLQYAFTTNDSFLILDRNGKNVAPFTLDFKGGNLNPLAVFDYDGKKDYRFVVTQNEKVFMYNNKGKIVSGFKYTKAAQNILEAPQHFKINRKDYLVFKLENNTLKILNRVGNERVKTKDEIPFSDNSIRLYQNTFAFTSANGMLYQINTAGKLSEKNLGLNVDHGFDATSKTLAIMNDNILTIRDKKVSLDLGVYSKPRIFYINDKIYISVTDIQNQKSYLFDSQANPIPNFPIYGSSIIDMADIDKDKKPELVIKDQENSFTVYSLN